MGLSPEISKTAFIASSAVVSGAVRIGDDASIWHNVTLRGMPIISPLALAQIFKIIAVFTLIHQNTQHHWPKCDDWP